MAQKFVTLTEVGSGDIYNVGSDAITYVIDDASTSSVEVVYIDTNKFPKKITVSETLAAIQTAAGNILTVTSYSTNESVGLSKDRSVAIKDGGDEASKAFATVTIDDVDDLDSDTITIDGTGLVEGTDFDAGADVESTAIALANAINANATISAKVTATQSGAVVTMVAVTAGTAGNAYTLALTDDSPTSPGASLSGATFTGGADVGDEVAGVQASGTITIDNNTTILTDVITIDGVAFTEGTDFDAGADTDATAAALSVAVNASASINDVTTSVAGSVVTVTAIDAGTAGNSITLAETGGGSTLSGATLSGGVAAAHAGAAIIVYNDGVHKAKEIKTVESVSVVVAKF